MEAKGPDIFLSGKVKHNCRINAVIELEWTVMRENGAVAFSQKFYVADGTLRPPNVEHIFTRKGRLVGRPGSYSVLVNSVLPDE
jgi:hypothetical protein